MAGSDEVYYCGAIEEGNIIVKRLFISEEDITKIGIFKIQEEIYFKKGPVK